MITFDELMTVIYNNLPENEVGDRTLEIFLVEANQGQFEDPEAAAALMNVANEVWQLGYNQGYARCSSMAA